MVNSFIAEIDKISRRPGTWGPAALFAALGVLFNYVIPYLSYTNPSGHVSSASQAKLLAGMLPAQMLPQMVSGFPRFGGAIALILAALTVGSEFGWGTLKTVLVQRPGRMDVLIGKLGAIAVALVGFVLVVFAAGALSSLIVATVEHAPAIWPSLGTITQAIGVGWFILAAWAALGVALAMLVRGTALSIGLGLVYVLVIEGLIIGFADKLQVLADISRALPGDNAGSLAASIIPSALQIKTPGLVATVGPTQAALVLAAYAVGFVLLSSLLLLKRDVT
ncbi:MAG: ABC transporter permease [Chloroflexota bacterium]